MTVRTLLGAVMIWAAAKMGAVEPQVLTASVGSYAAVSGACEAGRPILRLAGAASQQNQTVSPGEQEYLAGRRAVITPLWREFFTAGPGKLAGYDFPARAQDGWAPVFGIAHSGGGLRASLYGAGVVQALHSNTNSSPIRGVYQLATYAAGLSGGSWVVASMAANKYTSGSDMVSGWQLEKDLAMPGGINVLRTTQYLDQIYDTVELKERSGFKISITDLWGRALGYHFLPGTTPQNFYTNSPTTAHGGGMLMSGLRAMETYRRHEMAFPIVVSNHKPVDPTETNPKTLQVSGDTYIPLSAPVYECSPVEFGSFDPQLSAFIPTELLGTSLDAGKPYLSQSANQSSNPDPRNLCVRGFDQLGFIIGSSASLFNALTNLPTKYSSILAKLIKTISSSASGRSLTAQYPNPFKGVNGQTRFDRTASDDLEIVDGGENGENIPFSPLLAPARKLDVILAADASADSSSSHVNGEGWPTGASMINTFLRVHQVLPQGASAFPAVPLDPKTWEEKGLSSRPTFFGCEAPSNAGNGGYPLVIYLPNSPHTQAGYYTNTSTFKLQYSKEESSAFLAAVTRATAAPADPDWPTCLSCALIDRARSRLAVSRSQPCTTCFQRYCFSSDG